MALQALSALLGEGCPKGRVGHPSSIFYLPISSFLLPLFIR